MGAEVLSERKSPEEILEAAGFELLEEQTASKMLDGMLRSLAEMAPSFDGITRVGVHEELVKLLKASGVRKPVQMTDAALVKPPAAAPDRDDHQGHAAWDDPEPWPSPVSGHDLLGEVIEWLGQYVDAPESSLAATSLWSITTWFVSQVYFAPILAVLSPTKGSGKSLLLDLLRWICRKPVLTSGVGVTPAVVFRLNEEHQPTFLIDEAEKLSGKNGNRDIIGLLNQGYRRGSKIQRCRETKQGHVIDTFDAFGFRAVAAIGSLWDTLIDRAVVIPMQPKPPGRNLRRFNGRLVETEGRELARKIRRFAEDNVEEFEKAQVEAPRPESLKDRACDNWAALFAVAHLVGKGWPDLALDAARSLSNAVEDGDRAEQLIQDVRRVFQDKERSEVIQSGDLAECLNAIESSPWGDYQGKGITPHRLATMFKPFKIRPRQGRDPFGEKVRGYWLKDLQDVFERYPPRSELGQVGQPNKDAAFSDSQSGTEKESCPTSKSPETLANTGLSQLSHFERGAIPSESLERYEEDL